MLPAVATTRADPQARQPSAIRGRASLIAARALSFRRDRSGATAIEYALIGGLIFLAIVTGLQSYTTSVEGVYAKIRTAVTQ